MDSELRIDNQGTKRYFLNGVLHRGNDLPAVEHVNGRKVWYYMGIRHRTNGPAVLWANGTKEYWRNEQLHRDNNLPAIECVDGTKYWYINGKFYKVEYPKYNKTLNWCRNGF